MSAGCVSTATTPTVSPPSPNTTGKYILTPAPSQVLHTPTMINTPIAPGNAEYFFDSINGNDSASGTSQSTAWKSLAKMNSYGFQPGNIINLKRGSFWTGGLIISKSGTATNPILFRAYGDGTNPIFENPGDGVTNTCAVRINGSYVTVENILARNAFYSGFYINQNANYNIIRNSEVTNSGVGALINGNNNLVTGNYIHDLKMIVNDSGGTNDWGAVGVMIMNGPNEISYNRMINCRAPSYDFGYDGGAVEIYLNYGNADNSSFHHNYAENTDGFIEIHSKNLVYSANNVTVAQNVVVNTKTFFDIGMPGYGGGHELKSAQNIKVEQNTYVDAVLRPQTDWVGSIFSFHGVTPTASQVYVRNNIVYEMNASNISHIDGFTHTNNIYYLNPQGSSLGFTLNSTEKIMDPQFIDLTQNDFHLRATSPAINAGVNLDYALDFDGFPLPTASLPNIGAYQH